MSSNNANEIKREDKKAFKGFAIIIVVSLIVGGVLGFMSSALKEVLGENISSLLINILRSITPFASIVLSLIMIVISKIVYNNAKKRYNLYKESNDDSDSIDNEIDKIENNLSIVLMVTSINDIIGFFFFGMSSKLILENNINGGFDIVRTICAFAGFALSMISTMLIQKNIINFEKEINPLLKGSIYDSKFAEKWVDSCDEAMQLCVFKCAYKSYKVVGIACPILWLFCLIGYDLWDFGIVPMVIVTIIWLVQTISYCLESIKYCKVK